METEVKEKLDEILSHYSGKRMVHVIDQSKCNKCGTCLDVCPARFSAVVKTSAEELAVPSEPIPVTASKPSEVTSNNE